MPILVVEDEPRILAFVRRGLEAQGFTVDAAVDGVTGLRRARERHYDLVVLDLLLPGLDGLAVLRELTRALPELPVLILSARADVKARLRGFELGARDYMAKPFSLAELIARVRVHLRAVGAVDHDDVVLHAGPLELDFARRRVRTRGGCADLTDREFRLLHHLARHAGEVISREQLLAEVWGYHFDPQSNVVDVCVRRLRKKLGATSIETVRSVGYRIATS
ncbi:MAG: two component transcriptional regulator, winged helix family [Actinomycetia bacterium]|jgi:two-component system copper resistance phosphate regulon response regulator CusR|nr:two component transcriptional regulator, winged helix family [Actinomycetes bacterium]